MELFTLTDSFVKDNPIDTYESVIWTERYAEPGDCELVVENTPKMRAILTENTLLSTPESKEVMLIETVATTEDGLLSVSGPTLVGILRERVFRNGLGHNDSHLVGSISMSPRSFVHFMVGVTCTLLIIEESGEPDIPATWYARFGDFDQRRQVIDNLSVEKYSLIPGTPVDIALRPSIPNVYEFIKPLVDAYNLGITLHLESASPSAYALRFACYEGRNLTSDQSAYPLVRFSPQLDSLSESEELRSVSEYKNVAYAFADNFRILPAENDGRGWAYLGPPGIAYADSAAQASTNFRRRVLVVFADDITNESLAAGPGTHAEIGFHPLLDSVLTQRAKDGLANYTYTRVVDGEISPQSDYKFGEDYKLGDIVELQSHSGSIQKARITEYIRSVDKAGRKEYPTVSVVD